MEFDSEIAKLLGAGGIATALLALIYLVGMRLVRAIDALVTRIAAHETMEFEHHMRTNATLIAMDTRISEALNVREAVQDAVDEVSATHDVPDWSPQTRPGGYSSFKRKPSRGG